MLTSFDNAMHALGVKEYADEIWEAEEKKGQECFIENEYYS